MGAYPQVLLVDDEVRVMESLERLLDDDFHVHMANNAQDAFDILSNKPIQVVISDQRMPGMTGVDLLQQVRQQYPDVVRIMISGYTEPDDIIKAVNEAGIYTYITKPWNPEKLVSVVRNASELFQMHHENQRLALEMRKLSTHVKADINRDRQTIRDYYQADDGLVRSPLSPMNEISDTIHRVALYDVNVLITGEAGTGKQLCARTIHYNSERADKIFNVQQCASLTDEQLERELFGYKQGAFTEALSDHAGLLEQSDGGTLYLNQVEALSPSLQLKLLRFIQEGKIYHVGSTNGLSVDVRIIASSSVEIESAVRLGRFREDLYYQLAITHIALPSLAERSADIPAISKHILNVAMREIGKQVRGFTPEAIDYLRHYHWPGNVSELQNEIKRMLVVCDQDQIGIEYLSKPIVDAAISAGIDQSVTTDMSLLKQMQAIENKIIQDTLDKFDGDKQRAARALGLSLAALENRLTRYLADMGAASLGNLPDEAI